MPIYRERVIRTYQVIKLTKHMLQSASNLPGFLSEFHSLGLYTEADCIVYYGKKIQLLGPIMAQKSILK